MFDFSGEESSKLINGLKIGLGLIAGYLLMMFVMIYGTSVMRSVIEEKTSRIIEIIVSSVKPFQLMMGKILGNASAGLLQFFIWGILIFVITNRCFLYFWCRYCRNAICKNSSDQMETIKEVTAQEIKACLLFKKFYSFLF